MRKFNENYSLVRVLHAIPNGNTIDVYLNKRHFFKGLNFTEFTPYIYIPEGSHIIEIYAEDTVENPIISKKIHVNQDGLVTIAITQDKEGILILPIEEDKELGSYKKSKVRFAHLVVNGRVVNLLLKNKEKFCNIKFTDVTDYLELEPGEWQVSIEAAENNTIIRNIRIRVNSNRIYTFYAIGEAPNFDIIQSVDGATFLI